jgi:hypothetical protein
MTPQEDRHQHSIKVRIKEFGIPPIHDGLVLGKNSPIGCAALRKAIDLLVDSPFEHIEVDDEVISDILVRNKILRRIPQNRLVAFVLKRIKPLMGPDEILHLDLEAEVTLEDENL